VINQYFVIVDKRDSGKLELLTKPDFKNQKFWAFSEKEKSIYDKIKKGDKIYFAQKDAASFRFSSQVLKKIKNTAIPKKFWGNDFRSKSKKLVIIFGKTFEEEIPYHELLHAQKLSNPIPGIYKIKQKITLNKPRKKSKPEFQEKLSDKVGGVPERKTSVITHVVRDSKKVKDLKKLYQNKCQVCNYRLKIGNNKYYSEVHHLRPLRPDGGDDDFNNMLVVCANHHIAFDYCVIRIAKNSKNVIDKNNNVIEKLFIKKSHKISNNNIIYQFYRRLK